MYKFTEIERKEPDKRPVEERIEDFKEIYKSFTNSELIQSASRCGSCGIPMCQTWNDITKDGGCPLGNSIPDFLYLAANGRLREAYEVSAATNNFPEFCGKLCPQSSLCESKTACVIGQSNHGSVTIGAVESYLTDYAFEQTDWIKPILIEEHLEKKQSVGIIGAGPAGLAAGEQLRKQGYEIHIYDRYDRVGGLLIYGIPNFKLESDIVERRTKYLKDSGIKFHLNVNIGKDISFEDLRKKHDAIFIATGVYKSKELSIDSKFKNVVHALDYLTASNKKGLGDTVEDFESGKLNAKGKNVVVIGGGDTAMDAVRSAVRQKAKSVKCLYRRDKENMPGSPAEVENAEQEGVDFIWQSAPLVFKGKETVERVECVKMQMSKPDEDGRRIPVEIANSKFSVDADMIIQALGFDPENLPKLFNEVDLPVTDWGTIRVDSSNMMTNLKGVFAGGDIVRGASLVVWGIRDGREAAKSINSYLEKKNDSLNIKKAS